MGWRRRVLALGGVLMDRYQRTAIEHHCRLAAETIHPRFVTATPLYSIVLTVNSGYE